MRREPLIALAFSLLVTPKLVAQQKFSVPPQRPIHSPVSATAVPSAPPLRPEQLPASPPEVQFQRGQLTILASNSTLGDILRAVHQQTGASVDVPGNATERVVGQFGPGPARDVLASLLNGSHFNYVLLGSAENPVGLDRVILTSRSGNGSEQSAAAVGASMPQSQPNPAAMVVPQPDDSDDAASDDTSEAPDATDADDQGNAAQGDDQPQQPPPNALGQPSGVKTPEQLLQELQQRQQQLQQQGMPTAPGYPAPGVPQQQQ